MRAEDVLCGSYILVIDRPELVFFWFMRELFPIGNFVRINQLAATFDDPLSEQEIKGTQAYPGVGGDSKPDSKKLILYHYSAVLNHKPYM